ncbi:MAG: GntR family transcriptional regulator [Bacteroidaceae bacterium]|nr:GntR family transcriptional regulator [Bacteroidaceae bacterium]
MNEIRLGELNRLKIIKYVDFGFYVDGGRKYGRILLPQGEVTRKVDVGDEVDVFLYLDQEERLVATMRRPLAQVGEFAFLEVAWVNQFGAFLQWGLLKDLFVPFREQKMKMQKGQSYIVHVHLDPESFRIVASAKVERYLSSEVTDLKPGDKVDVLVWQKTDLGFKAIVNNKYSALIYDNQVFRPLRTGDRLEAYVRLVRPDGKIDITLQPTGQQAALDFSDVLLRYLQQNGGRTVLGDKSPAEDIYEAFGVSKKVFKKAVGDLYKRHLVTLTSEGIELAD